MAIKYYDAPDVQEIAEELIKELEWNHISLDNISKDI